MDKYIKVKIEDLISLNLKEYIDKAKEHYKKCEYCGNEYYTNFPKRSKYCKKCHFIYWQKLNIERSRELKRNWAKKQREELKK